MKIFNKVIVMISLVVVLLVGEGFANLEPSITPSIPSGSTVNPGDRVTVTIEVNDENAYGIQECLYSWNNGANISIFDSGDLKGLAGEYGRLPYSFETFSDEAGEYILKIMATDDKGNTTGIKEFRYYIAEDKIVEDKIPPTIIANKADNSVVKAGSRVTVVIEDDDYLDEIVYSWNDGEKEYPLKSKSGEYKKFTETMPQFPEVNDTCVLKISAKDMSGNITDKTYKYIVEFDDKTAPDINMSIPGGVVDAGTELVLKVVDNESKVTTLKYNWEGMQVKDVIPNEKEPANDCKVSNLIVGSKPGKYRFHVTAINAAGKEAAGTYEYIVLPKQEKDTIAPTITPDKPNNSVVKAGSRLTVVVKDNDVLDEIVYSWNDDEKEYPLDSEPEDEIFGIYNIEMKKFPAVNGPYVLKISATDESGNTTDETYTYIVNDTNVGAPVISVSIPSGSIVDAGTKLTMEVNDDTTKVTKLIYNWEGMQVKDVIPDEKVPANYCKVSNLTIGSKPGKYRLHVTAENAVGKKVTGVYEYTVLGEEKDTEKPTVEVTPNGGKVDGGDAVKIKGKDNEGLESIEYFWDDDNVTVEPVEGKDATIYTEVPDEPGKHVLNVTVEDEDGNKATAKIEFTVDKEEKDEDPEIEVSPKNKSTVKGGKVVKATLTDDIGLKKVTYNWEKDDETTKSISGTTKTIDLPALPNKSGTYKVNITVEDTAGNKTTGTYTYYVENNRKDDNEDPTVDADPDGGEMEYGDKIVVSAEDDDGEIEYVEYYWDDDDKTRKYSDRFTVKVPSEEGKHYLYVRAMDDSNNLCDYEKFTYNIRENRYPGNSDFTGDINERVRGLRVEIRNADDKIRFEPREEILYYVDYYNGTSSKETNVKLVVDLPTYLEADRASDKGDVTTKKVTWNLGTLSAGESGRVSFTANYTSSKVNEKIISVPAKIYSGSSLRDTSTVRNMIFCVNAEGTGNHNAYCVGYPDGAFRAEGKITRAELASMIANIQGITSTHRGQFVDANNHWAANYMQAVFDRGYMKPRGYNMFGAQDYATRADLAYAIAAILDVEDLEPIFISASDTRNSEARCAIEQLLRLGIMDGYADGTAKPNSNVTRAEAVTIINNYLFRGGLYTRGYNYSYNFETNYNHGGNYYILKFIDLSQNHWAYSHIMEATNNHRYQRIMDGNEEML